jgi:hypothetical protein
MSTEFESKPSARLRVTATGDVRRVPFRGPLVIGRGPGETGWTVHAAIDGVSRRHIEVFFGDDLKTVVVCDTGNYGQGSTFGTFVNGVRIPPAQTVELKHNDRVRLGPLGGIELVFLDEITYVREDIVCGEGMVFIKDSQLLPQLKRTEYQIFQALLEHSPFAISLVALGESGWYPEEPPFDPRSIQRTVQRLAKRLDEEFGRSSLDNRSIRFVNKGYRLCLFD